MPEPHFDAHQPVLILGTGAMACLFAGRLAAVGVPVIMLGSWKQALSALDTFGVRIDEKDASPSAYPVRTATSPEHVGRVQYALVLLKSWQTAQAARQLTRCLAPDGVAMTLQNGIGNGEILVEILGSDRVAVGVTTYGGYLLEPGLVRPAGQGVISIGEHPHVAALAATLREAGFFVEISPDVTTLLWGKLVINASINPIAALLNLTNGGVVEYESTRKLLDAAVKEATAVATAKGINLPYADPQGTVETIARRTAANRSSMLQDLLRGAQTEADAILGAIVQAGEQTGVPTPVLYTLWNLVKARVEIMAVP